MLNQNFLDDLEDDAIEEEEDQQNEQELTENAQQNEASQEFNDFNNKDFSDLLKDENFSRHQNLIKEIQKKKNQEQVSGIDRTHQEYQLILKSNEYSSIINQEYKKINNVHKSLKDIYQKRFPELEQIILNPVEYVKIVQQIGKEIDINQIHFQAILSGHLLMAVNVAASSTIGQPLKDGDFEQVQKLCDEIMRLDVINQELLQFIESRMLFISPNLSSLVGTQLASKLIATAGGIEQLASMPSCNIQVMGGQRRSMLGNSRGIRDKNRGLFTNLELVQKAPPKFQTQLIRMLSTNVSKAARIDSMRTCQNGSAGERLKEQMLQRFEKIQEPPPPKINKPLVPPDDKPKKKRGGKRYRKQKERMAISEMRKFQNRLKFGEEGEEEIGSSGKGLGMVSQGIGKVRQAISKQNKVTLTKQQQQRLNKLKPAQGITGGMISSIAFTQSQGMELVNPELQNRIFQKKPEQYFNRSSGFKTVLEERQKQ